MSCSSCSCCKAKNEKLPDPPANTPEIYTRDNLLATLTQKIPFYQQPGGRATLDLELKSLKRKLMKHAYPMMLYQNPVFVLLELIATIIIICLVPTYPTTFGTAPGVYTKLGVNIALYVITLPVAILGILGWRKENVTLLGAFKVGTLFLIVCTIAEDVLVSTLNGWFAIALAVLDIGGKVWQRKRTTALINFLTARTAVLYDIYGERANEVPLLNSMPNPTAENVQTVISA